MRAMSSLPLPALLRRAWATFGAAIRTALDGAGFDDLPPNGPYVLAAVAATGASLSDVIAQLGVSKQAAGQLVDTLVARGYLDRSVDPDDRRRLVVRATDRGIAAARVVSDAAAVVEESLAASVGSTRLDHTRRVLAALALKGQVDD
jgi:DNA-binding MarR family transcriptional regulator